MFIKLRQILAIAGIILLVALYALTLVAALFDPSSTMNYLMAAVGATIMIPVILWLLNLMIKSISHNKDSDDVE